jgi:hypothetical protein
MITNSTSSHGTPPPSADFSKKSRSINRSTDTAGENLSTHHAETLKQALARTPEIRPEVVENGQKLAVDPQYPPREIIEDISRLITASEDLTQPE